MAIIRLLGNILQIQSVLDFFNRKHKSENHIIIYSYIFVVIYSYIFLKNN